LRALAEFLTPDLHAIAQEWTRRLVAMSPEDFSAGMTVDAVTMLNEAFLQLVLGYMLRGDIEGLWRGYYELNRAVIERSLQSGQRLSLDGMYRSALISATVIAERLGPQRLEWSFAMSKLSGQMMVVVGQAYSDSREAHLDRLSERASVVSHELRAPLSRLFGYLELMREGEFGAVSQQQERVLDTLLRETDDLLWLLTGTLELTRLDASRPQLRIEEFALHELNREVLESIQGADKHVQLRVPQDLPRLSTDRVRVKQVLTNLVRNAVRYGGGKPVDVDARVAGAGVEISVIDQGPGLRTQELESVFTLFEQGTAGQLSADGYGIGLHVVQRLVALLGGKLSVESQPGRGAAFRFALPLSTSGSA
jgi:signal transduction histidine kinase